MQTEQIKKEIYETRKQQHQYSFGMKKQNANKFGEYERKLEKLYRELDASRN